MVFQITNLWWFHVTSPRHPKKNNRSVVRVASCILVWGHLKMTFQLWSGFPKVPLMCPCWPSTTVSLRWWPPTATLTWAVRILINASCSTSWRSSSHLVIYDPSDFGGHGKCVLSAINIRKNDMYPWFNDSLEDSDRERWGVNICKGTDLEWFYMSSSNVCPEHLVFGNLKLQSTEILNWRYAHSYSMLKPSSFSSHWSFIYWRKAYRNLLNMMKLLLL